MKNRLAGALLFSTLTVVVLLNSCSSTEESPWKVMKEYPVPYGLNPFGLTNYDTYIIISDSSANRVVIFNMADLSIYDEYEINQPMYIKVRKGILIIPSMGDDSIYVMRGEGRQVMESSASLNDPVAVEAFLINHFAHVDRGNNRVLYENAPRGIQSILTGNPSGTNNLSSPSEVLIRDSLLYVADSGNGVIKVFRETGELEFEFGEKENLEWPAGLTQKGDTIFVSDPVTNRVLLYSSKGKFIELIEAGLNKPQGINYHLGRLYIANQGSQTVTVWLEDDQLK